MQVKRDLNKVKEMEYIRQSELAELTGVRPSTIKYYSELGLISYKQEGERLSKRYDREDSIKRVQEILELRKQGKSIAEIIEYYIK
ncbi:MAG TPA: MerR family transcriptional regulator [bacterium]|jgi:DNA-binding transcriptional MerR regulator|nr:MerR family transcriptional regulator [bacterium]